MLMGFGRSVCTMHFGKFNLILNEPNPTYLGLCGGFGSRKEMNLSRRFEREVINMDQDPRTTFILLIGLDCGWDGQ